MPKLNDSRVVGRAGRIVGLALPSLGNCCIHQRLLTLPLLVKTAEFRHREDCNSGKSLAFVNRESHMMADYRQHAISNRFYRASRWQRVDAADLFSGVKDVTYRLRIARHPMGHDWAAGSIRASGPVNTSSRPVAGVPDVTPSKSTAGTTA